MRQDLNHLELENRDLMIGLKTFLLNYFLRSQSYVTQLVPFTKGDQSTLSFSFWRLRCSPDSVVKTASVFPVYEIMEEILAWLHLFDSY